MRRIRFAAAIATVFVTAGVALADAPSSLHTERITDTGERTGQRLVAEYTQTLKSDGANVRRRVADVYDWDSGWVIRYVLDGDGRIIETETVDGALGPRPEEIREAIDIVRADPEIALMLRRNPSLTVDGGFLFVQADKDGPCAIGTRCLQIIVGDGPNELRRALVDLKSRRIVAQDYFTPAGGVEQ